MQRHNYTITPSFSNIVHHLWKCCVMPHDCRIASTISVLRRETVWRDEAKNREIHKKTHCRINGIKGGVVMNTNACTSNVIVSLYIMFVSATITFILLNVSIACPIHTLVFCRWCCIVHISLLLMNFLPFSILDGRPKKMELFKMNWTTLVLFQFRANFCFTCTLLNFIV